MKLAKRGNRAVAAHIISNARSAPTKINPSIYQAAAWTSDEVNIRSTASGTVVSQLVPGQQVFSGHSTNGWTPVKAGNITGWVSSQYLASSAAAAAAVAAREAATKNDSDQSNGPSSSAPAAPSSAPSSEAPSAPSSASAPSAPSSAPALSAPSSSPAAPSTPTDNSSSGLSNSNSGGGESPHQQCEDAINSGDTSQARANGWMFSCEPYISSDGSDASGTGQTVAGMTYPSRKHISICDCAGQNASFESVVTYEAGHARGTQLSQAAINWLVSQLGTPWFISGPNYKTSVAERWSATVSLCAGNPTPDASRYAFSCSMLAHAESM